MLSCITAGTFLRRQRAYLRWVFVFFVYKSLWSQVRDGLSLALVLENRTYVLIGQQRKWQGIGQAWGWSVG